MENFILISCAIFGAIFGSFLNVCIFRLPNEESIVQPRSKCPNCERIIPWYLNIPIISYVSLLGKCRYCKFRISIRYLIVEVLACFVAIEVYRHIGLSIEALIWFLFCCSLIVIAFIDISHRIIPNIISLPGIVIGFLFSFTNNFISPIESILGILLGGGSLYAIAVVYKKIRKIDGMGMGDVKLLGMIGAFLGWQSLLFVVLISSLSGSIIGLSFILANRLDLKYQIPFGTFLAFSAIIYLLYGVDILAVYESFLVRSH